MLPSSPSSDAIDGFTNHHVLAESGEKEISIADHQILISLEPWNLVKFIFRWGSIR